MFGSTSTFKSIVCLAPPLLLKSYNEVNAKFILCLAPQRLKGTNVKASRKSLLTSL